MTQTTESRPTVADAGAPEIVMPDTDAAQVARVAKAQATAAKMIAGHSTGIEGREEEFFRAVTDVLRTFDHTQGYEHQVNDALVKAWLTSIRFARTHGLMAEWVTENVDVMNPILRRMKGIIETTGEREVALEAICGWSTCHHQLVLTETHKEPGKRSFISPFGRVLEQGRKIGQFDFDETFVMEQFFIPRAHGFADVIGVPIETTWDPETRLFSIALA